MKRLFLWLITYLFFWSAWMAGQAQCSGSIVQRSKVTTGWELIIKATHTFSAAGECLLSKSTFSAAPNGLRIKIGSIAVTPLGGSFAKVSAEIHILDTPPDQPGLQSIVYPIVVHAFALPVNLRLGGVPSQRHPTQAPTTQASPLDTIALRLVSTGAALVDVYLIAEDCEGLACEEAR